MNARWIWLSFWLVITSLLVPAVWAQDASSIEDVSQWDEPPPSRELAAAGVVPVQTVNVDEARFYLSTPFELDESHQIAVIWVQVAGERRIRALYRSNSQCTWRLCDAITPSHIGKGFHEFDKQVPADVTIALLRLSEQVGDLKPWFKATAEQPSQKILARKLLELLAVDRDEGIKNGAVLTIGSRYVTREYASLIPLLPRPFSFVLGQLQTPSGGTVADPTATKLPPVEQLPDFTRTRATVAFRIPAYARFTQTDGSLTGRVYDSHDGQFRYFYVEDSQQRIMLASVELVHAQVCSLGLRTTYPDVSGMDAPLIEYAAQIPEVYGGHRKARYQSNWNWVRRQPIVECYYRATNRPMPPEE